ncbi:NAD(P)H-dependent oxidoreductase subunit E [uncultured Acetobacteroides sp.]|uniref:NADH-quinone oxidoreductase subunit NuoE family protein n=1 Tax=uncultured Acetobacteroides sp. TaxID=1760811 RepID=UPI0029F482BD|nr:NAD(P)H-dependent oxidoreductase subunit E [uncultured Acetobacteroides sp.]
MTHIEELVRELVDKHGTQRSSLMAVLQEIVGHERYLSEEAMLTVAREFNISAADVFGTASFYTFLDTVPRGRNIIRVCKTITCHMKGKDQLIAALEEALDTHIGGTTADGQFTLLTANCLGWCHKGPVMLVNNDVYPAVTPESAIAIISKYRP